MLHWITYPSIPPAEITLINAMRLELDQLYGRTEGSKLPTYSATVTTDGLGDIDKPLSIKREALIARLQENLDKEQAARADMEARAAASRQAAVDAIHTLTDDELHNIVARFLGGGGRDLVEQIQKAKEDETFVTPKLAVSRRENDLEKFVRVLGMASDSVIEVKPNQPIYSLL